METPVREQEEQKFTEVMTLNDECFDNYRLFEKTQLVYNLLTQTEHKSILNKNQVDRLMESLIKDLPKLIEISKTNHELESCFRMLSILANNGKNQESLIEQAVTKLTA